MDQGGSRWAKVSKDPQRMQRKHLAITSGTSGNFSAYVLQPSNGAGLSCKSCILSFHIRTYVGESFSNPGATYTRYLIMRTQMSDGQNTKPYDKSYAPHSPQNVIHPERELQRTWSVRPPTRREIHSASAGYLPPERERPCHTMDAMLPEREIRQGGHFALLCSPG